MNLPIPSEQIDTRASDLLEKMSLQEKIGQMNQLSGNEGYVSEHLAEQIRQGRVGSVINEVDVHTVNELQRLAIEESRLGIPLLIGRDVIHGFKTIFPIPLGQAASWHEDLITSAASISALEASHCGINWTFAPVVDISREPRWGRIAETLGEDPYLTGKLGSAMVRGFQGENLSSPGSIAACAKHFAVYGAAESGRDYNTTNVPENEIRNVYLRPFKVVADAGVASFMSGFNDLNGVPTSGNEWLLSQVLRDEWQYSGIVVSDWESIHQLSIHGFTQNSQEAAFEAANAGVEMEMVSTCFQDHLPALIEQGRIQQSQIDISVMRILTLKIKLGLFENPYTQVIEADKPADSLHLEVAKKLAQKSCVLLQNKDDCLPLNQNNLNSIAVIGPLADDDYEQLGTWIFDGEVSRSQTCLQAITSNLKESVEVHYVKGLNTSRSRDTDAFDEALNVAEKSDAVILFLGEESILSGEAHCRAELDLPGSQEALIDHLQGCGKPTVLVVMAGRPLALEIVLPKVDALLYAWHPGSMAGPAIYELLFGLASPSGKLPITFPRKVGQIPIYYGQKHGGKPVSQETYVHMDEFEVRAAQTSMGMTSAHIDTHFTPLFPFGFGLNYADLSYSDISLEKSILHFEDDLHVSAFLSNFSELDCEEVAQLYVRDLVANVTRPVKELKSFQRVFVAAGERKKIEFSLSTDQLGFFNRQQKWVVEAGHFQLWIGGSSDASLSAEFEIIDDL